MVERSDNEPILRGGAILEEASGIHAKPFRFIRHDRGGGHQLFYNAGYWWDDFQTFLNVHLVERRNGRPVVENVEAGKK
jgi:hypothetical protein